MRPGGLEGLGELGERGELGGQGGGVGESEELGRAGRSVTPTMDNANGGLVRVAGVQNGKGGCVSGGPAEAALEKVEHCLPLPQLRTLGIWVGVDTAS